MNTLFRKTKIFSKIINSIQIFRNSSLQFNRKHSHFSLSPYLQYNKLIFSDKPPKGFENFNRKKKTNIIKEKTEKPLDDEEKSPEKKKG